LKKEPELISFGAELLLKERNIGCTFYIYTRQILSACWNPRRWKTNSLSPL